MNVIIRNNFMINQFTLKPISCTNYKQHFKNIPISSTDKKKQTHISHTIVPDSKI